MKHPGKLFIVSGPSQVGKDSLVEAVKKIKSLRLRGITTNTTRLPRPGEQSGRGLNFLSEKKFDHLIKTGQLLEWAYVRGSKFGTPKKPVLSVLKNGYNAIINIDVQGAVQIKKILPPAVLIFITAESAHEVKKRIFASSKMTLKQKKYRWQEAQIELEAKKNYHHILINRWGKLNETTAELRAIIASYSQAETP